MCKLCINCINYNICPTAPLPTWFVCPPGRGMSGIPGPPGTPARGTARLGETRSWTSHSCWAGSRVWSSAVTAAQWCEDISQQTGRSKEKPSVLASLLFPPGPHLVSGELAQAHRLLLYLTVQISECPQHQLIGLLHPHLLSSLNYWEFVANISPLSPCGFVLYTPEMYRNKLKHFKVKIWNSTKIPCTQYENKILSTSFFWLRKLRILTNIDII